MIPKKIFISYSHKDEPFKDQLMVHLSSLKRRGFIQEWHDRKLKAGEEWDKKIKQELLDADIILLLISSDFIASNYCFDVEITKAMERHNQNNAIVVPIILRPCDWSDLSFGKVQALPKDAFPISKWSDIDEGYLNIIEGIKSIIKNQSSKFDTNADEGLKTQIKFDEDVIIYKLPRGYIVIMDIGFKTFDGWSIKAQYYNYDGTWRHGTHYHESYQRTWQSPDGQDSQCFKLGIEKSDWIYAYSALSLIVSLRHRNKNQTINDIISNFDNEFEFVQLLKSNEKIETPFVPKQFINLNKTGKIRDIISELEISIWKNYDLNTLHQDCESNRRKAYLILYDKLGKDHPALIFAKDIIDKYDSGKSLEELRIWRDNLSDALRDCCNYIKYPPNFCFSS